MKTKSVTELANPSMADLEQAVSNALTTLEQAEEKLRAARSGYETALHDANPKASCKAKEAIETAAIGRDRAAAQLEKLREQLADAQKRDAHLARQGALEEAERLSEEGRRLILETYPRVASELSSLLHRLEEITTHLTRVNRDFDVSLRLPEEYRATPARHERRWNDVFQYEEEKLVDPGWCYSACNFDPLTGGIGVQN